MPTPFRAPSRRSPACAVEEGTAPDGSPVARVRVSLERAAKHRVRSSRNLILVEVERAAGAALTARPSIVPRRPVALAKPFTLTARSTTTAARVSSEPATRASIRQGHVGARGSCDLHRRQRAARCLVGRGGSGSSGPRAVGLPGCGGWPRARRHHGQPGRCQAGARWSQQPRTAHHARGDRPGAQASILC